MSHDPVTAFAAAISEAGIGAPDIIPDGNLHRHHVAGDRPGTRNGWYVLYLDGVPAGAFGSWKTGESLSWSSRAKADLTLTDRIRLKHILAQARQRHSDERRQEQESAATTAMRMWTQARPAAPRHPYLVVKQVGPHGIRQSGSLLLVPVTDGERLISLQTITTTGDKRFLKGGRMASGFYSIADAPRPSPLLIGEGFATVATVVEQTGCPGLVAFNAGNLLAVAQVMRRRYPETAIIITGDNDQWTPGNPGATQARAAAVAIHAKLLIPDFTGLDLSSKPTDWNDFYRLTRANQARRAA